MALSTVLSAMRILILDGWEIPSDIQARRELYREKFSPLSESELEDLAVLAPEKLRVYTNTIYSGERGTLEMHFPFVFALLKDRLREDFDGFRMVQELHKFRPWHGNTTLALAESFVAFLGSPTLPAGENIYAKSAPEARDLALMECFDLQISRGLNPIDLGIPVFDRDEIAALNVGTLLELTLLIPRNARWFTCEFDVLGFRTAFTSSDGVPPSKPTARRKMYVAGGRNRAHFVRWVEISPSVMNFFDSAKGSSELPMSDLVEAALENVDGESEEALFQSFMDTFTGLEQSGIIFIKK